MPARRDSSSASSPRAPVDVRPCRLGPLRCPVVLARPVRGANCLPGENPNINIHRARQGGFYLMRGSMSNYHDDHIEEMEDDYDMDDPADDMIDEHQEREVRDSDSEEDDYGPSNDKIPDTSSADARKGKDIQGIPWERLAITREKYRQTRLEQYKNYENITNSGEEAMKLRNLVWATSKHDVYLMSHFSVLHWSALSGVDTELMNVKGHVAPREHLNREGISFCCRTTYDDNAITNAVEIFNTSSGAVHFIASNNDSGVRDYDMERFQLCKHFQFEWPVNHTSLSPDRKVVVIVGDVPDGLLIDANTGKTLHSMKGHHDYSFASAWNPDGRTFATGNQDKTCRIWDVRNLSKAVHVLRGNLGAIRSIRFTSDGQFMSMAEPADFVHIYDVKSDYNRRTRAGLFW
ncbi:hypothetical protein PR202_gb09598 [Eleusine coracana subsp. coracana]|uniref:Uncharacterized protein n=1 Tax=Eleusine coracana subsp. coracana TaxID=191504 RepID=A0AAV5EH04_ELECO|nr:hypothetical protein PR202_gb09598 [Eleusine coracana subsp. coracana]